MLHTGELALRPFFRVCESVGYFKRGIRHYALFLGCVNLSGTLSGDPELRLFLGCVNLSGTLSAGPPLHLLFGYVNLSSTNHTGETPSHTVILSEAVKMNESGSC